MSKKSRGQTAVDVREVTRTDCSLLVKMTLLSEEFRQDGKEVTRTDCSQVVNMVILSEGFRQDVGFIFVRTTGKLASYAANRCMRGVGSHVVKVNLLSEELRQDVQTQENRHPTQELMHEVYVELVRELISNYLTTPTKVPL